MSFIDQHHSKKSEIAYRADIDGLRAVAIVSVVLFHADLGLPGGFVGVDVFFVISGYLITSIIQKELSAGTFTILSFYERRIRRIIPAQLAMVLATAFVGWHVLLPENFVAFAKSLIAQSVFAGNVFFYRNTGYFDGAAEEKPLLHTWSLAVEEQFYFFIPWLLLVFARLKLKPQAPTRELLIAFFFLSFLIGAGEYFSPMAKFYLMPFRAWELLLGCIIATGAGCGCRARWFRESLSSLGLAMIFIACFAYTKDTLFPGPAALLPTLGAAFIILVNSGRDSVASPTLVSRLLGRKEFVFIGLTSYSLYLWHWPVFAFARCLSPLPLTLSQRLLLVSLSAAVAILSWKFVEQPFRKSPKLNGRPLTYGLCLVATLFALILGGGIIKASGFAGRFPRELLVTAENLGDMQISLDEAANGDFYRLGDPNSVSSISVMVWGDSHAMSAVPAIDLMLRNRQLAGLGAMHAATAPVRGWYAIDRKNGLNEGSLQFSNAVFEKIRLDRIAHVMIIACWQYYDDPLMEAALLQTIQDLRLVGCQPWIMLQVPFQPCNVPKAVLRSVKFGESLERYSARPTEWNGIADGGDRFLRALADAGAEIIDPRPGFVDPQTGLYRIESSGAPLYYDDNHITPEAARSILLPTFEQTIGAALRSSAATAQSLDSAD